MDECKPLGEGVTVPYNSNTARPLAEGGSDLESDPSLVVFALGCLRVVTEAGGVLRTCTRTDI